MDVRFRCTASDRISGQLHDCGAQKQCTASSYPPSANDDSVRKFKKSLNVLGFDPFHGFEGPPAKAGTPIALCKASIPRVMSPRRLGIKKNFKK